MTDKDKDTSITIIVNGREKTVDKKEQLTFAEVVELAFPGEPPTETLVYTVTYSRGEGNKPEGDLAPGGSVKVKKGMIFNVFATNRS